MQSYTPRCIGIILAFTTIYVSWGHGDEVNDLKASRGLAVGVRASCELAAGGVATAWADLTPWGLPSSEALLWGLARASAPPHRSPACPWPWAAGPDLLALPGALAGGGGMGLLLGKMATACLVITLGSRLPLLIPDNKCGQRDVIGNRSSK